MIPAPILVIIADNDSRNLAVEALDYAGYPTVEAGTAADGLRLVREHLPSAIVLDVFWLPDFDGLQLMRVLQGHTQTNTIPVVALASRADWDELEGAGFANMVDNPIDLDAFSAALIDAAGPVNMLPERETG